MNFYNAIKRDIDTIKGDSLAFNFQIQGLNGSEPTGIYFTCREKPESETYYFQRALGNGISLISYDAENDTATYSLRVRPDQMGDITAGRYYYDMELDVNGDVLTLIKGRLNIDWDVTRG